MVTPLVIIIDGWVFNIIKNYRNSWILEKEGKYYRVNKQSKKFERLKGEFD